MKADHQSKQYRLEDQLLKYFPEEIEKHKGQIVNNCHADTDQKQERNNYGIHRK